MIIMIKILKKFLMMDRVLRNACEIRFFANGAISGLICGKCL